MSRDAHDWEEIHSALSAATGAWNRDELVALLRDLIQAYVIDRGLPTGTAQEVTTPDLTAYDFPQLVTWLKANLTVPELGLFQVDGRKVIVDADGPRELRVSRATEPLDRADLPRLSPPGRGARRASGPPAATPSAAAPKTPSKAPALEMPADEPAAPRRKLSKGLRGLEFD